MPAIQVRESEPFRITAASQQSEACKYLVEQMVSLNPDLIIDTVVTDTTSQYEAIVRVVGSRVGFRIYNSGDYLYVGFGAWKASGSFVAYKIYSNRYFFSYSSSGTYVKVFSTGVDGVLKYVAFASSYASSEGIYLSYSMFTSATSLEPVHTCNAYTIDKNWPVGPSFHVVSKIPGYFYDSDLDDIQSVSFTEAPNNINEKKQWVNAGYLYALVQKATSGYSDTKGFLDIKWGGAYDLYYLVDSTGSEVYTQFGETVSINGVSTLSGGTVALIV